MDGIEILGVINREAIQTRKQQWLDQLAQVQQRIEALKGEINNLQSNVHALDGACQACDVFLQLIDSSAEPSTE